MKIIDQNELRNEIILGEVEHQRNCRLLIVSDSLVLLVSRLTVAAFLCRSLFELNAERKDHREKAGREFDLQN